MHRQVGTLLPGFEEFLQLEMLCFQPHADVAGCALAALVDEETQQDSKHGNKKLASTRTQFGYGQQTKDSRQDIHNRHWDVINHVT